MATMKAAHFATKGAPLELAQVGSCDDRSLIMQVPIPNPGKNQVRVKVHACGICHSDVGVQYGAFGGSFPAIPYDPAE